jgi:hypothetical protein
MEIGSLFGMDFGGTLVVRGRHIIILLIVILGVQLSSVRAQPAISGVINQYVQVTNVVPCDSMVAVGNPSSFKSGDRVLLIQMKGAKIVTDNTPAFGTITDIAGAGSAEFLTIKSVSNEYIIFTSRFANWYDPAGFVQLIRVPVYDDVRVVGPLIAPEWNGTVGGVIALEARGTVHLEADISADGLGFRGGRVSLPIDACETQDHILNWNFGRSGEKGEGIASMRVNYPIAGRGPLATGGGGGNGTNAGGAGGSNGGAGGAGGQSVNHCTIKTVGGLPGSSTAAYAATQRFFLGGGGGGGHQNDLVGTSGAHGGGLIIIRAATLRGNNKKLSANGLSVGDPPPPLPGKSAGMDGAGGGGAGGTVVLDVTTVATPVHIVVKGGDGGNILHEYNAHGPGGGGGGGLAILRVPSPNVTVDAAGGKAGLHLETANEAYNSTNGATDGATGATIAPFEWKTPISVGLDVWGGGKICEGLESVTIEASPGFAVYTWNNGATGRVINVDKAGTYSCTAIDSSGCTFTAGNVPVWYNPTQFTMPSTLDFGDVPFEATVSMTIPIENTDDDDIVLTRVVNDRYSTIVDPVSLPLVIPAGSTYLVRVEFFAGEDKVHRELLRFFFDKPCPDSQDVVVTAVVRPIWATIFVPDTTATVGDSSFTIPIYASVRPDTITLAATHMTVALEIDSRIFHPTGVTRGRIIENTIDLLTNVRRLTIEIDSIDLYQDRNLLTGISGITLLSTVKRSPITIKGTQWLKVWQVPITDKQDGSILVDDVCGKLNRVIRFHDLPSLVVAPNPAHDVFTLNTQLTAPGPYSLSIIDMMGNTVHHESMTYAGDATVDRAITVDASTWSSGSYIVHYSTPLLTFTNRVVVEH